MAVKVGFFTPINFGNQPTSTTEWLLEKADGFFYLGGPKAHIIKTNQAVLVNENQSLLVTCFKVASYFTIFLPTIPLLTQVENPLAILSCFALLVPIMLIAKVVLRYTHSYEIDDLAHQPIDPSVIDTLGLDLDEEGRVDAQTLGSLTQFECLSQYIPSKPFTLGQAATEVIAKINEAIQEKSITDPQASVKEKHRIFLRTDPPWVTGGSNLYFYKLINFSMIDSEQIWLNRIIQALVAKKHIQLIREYHGIYTIQV